MHNEATSTNDVMIGSAEAASLLSIDRSTLSRWAKSGKLKPAVKGNGLRGNCFFRRSDVQALAENPTDSQPAKAS